MSAIRVGVAGAAGKMGQAVCAAVVGAQDMELAGRADPALGASLQDILGDVDVVVDFTRPDTALDNALACVEAGVHVVIGTTGFDAAPPPESEAAADGAAASGGAAGVGSEAASGAGGAAGCAGGAAGASGSLGVTGRPCLSYCGAGPPFFRSCAVWDLLKSFWTSSSFCCAWSASCLALSRKPIRFSSRGSA